MSGLFDPLPHPTDADLPPAQFEDVARRDFHFITAKDVFLHTTGMVGESLEAFLGSTVTDASVGEPNGVAPLDGNSDVPVENLPDASPTTRGGNLFAFTDDTLRNVGFGHGAGAGITTGTDGVFIGDGALPSGPDAVNQVAIGSNAQCTANDQLALGPTINSILAQGLTSHADGTATLLAIDSSGVVRKTGGSITTVAEIDTSLNDGFRLSENGNVRVQRDLVPHLSVTDNATKSLYTSFTFPDTGANEYHVYFFEWSIIYRWFDGAVIGSGFHRGRAMVSCPQNNGIISIPSSATDSSFGSNPPTFGTSVDSPNRVFRIQANFDIPTVGDKVIYVGSVLVTRLEFSTP